MTRRGRRSNSAWRMRKRNRKRGRQELQTQRRPRVLPLPQQALRRQSRNRVWPFRGWPNRGWRKLAPGTKGSTLVVEVAVTAVTKQEVLHREKAILLDVRSSNRRRPGLGANLYPGLRPDRR